MDFLKLLEQKKITPYKLIRHSGVPEETVMEVCTGNCLPKDLPEAILLQISDTLGCSVEELLSLSTPSPADIEDGYPIRALPPWLVESIVRMQKSWARLDQGLEDMRRDAWWCDLNASINIAEVEKLISSDHAEHLREKYLRMKKEE